MQGVPDPGSAAAAIEFLAVTKRYPGREAPAVRELSLSVPAGEICVLIGPSGSGKTTAMKMVNRLIDITEGDITIGDQSVRSLDLTELRRGIGYVFQQIGLFPHMSVEDNIGTVPRLLGWDKQRIRDRVGELLELVGLEQSDAKRYPGQFSGGQRQRIGVARAMAADQPIMLMDEPFGAVDPIARDRLQNDFLRLHAEVRRRSSSSRTTSTRPSRWATGSPSSGTASSSSTGRPTRSSPARPTSSSPTSWAPTAASSACCCASWPRSS